MVNAENKPRNQISSVASDIRVNWEYHFRELNFEFLAGTAVLRETCDQNS